MRYRPIRRNSEFTRCYARGKSYVHPNLVLYVVQKGDTLWEIARRYQTTVPLLADLNNIENADLIYPGQKLLILRRTV